MVLNRKWKIFWIVMTVLVMGIIFFFSSQGTYKSENVSDAVASLFSIEQEDASTRVSNQKLFFGLTLRKIAHIILYMALGFCFFQDYAGMRIYIAIPLTIGSGYLYAVLDEWHQQIIGRHGRWEDTLIDLTGVVIGMLLSMLWLALLRWILKRKGKLIPAENSGKGQA